jgi:hypothetical protein
MVDMLPIFRHLWFNRDEVSASVVSAVGAKASGSSILGLKPGSPRGCARDFPVALVAFVSCAFSV